jgi:hypothetical protein
VSEGGRGHRGVGSCPQTNRGGGMASRSHTQPVFMVGVMPVGSSTEMRVRAGARRAARKSEQARPGAAGEGEAEDIRRLGGRRLSGAGSWPGGGELVVGVAVDAVPVVERSQASVIPSPAWCEVRHSRILSRRSTARTVRLDVGHIAGSVALETGARNGPRPVSRANRQPVASVTHRPRG